MDDSLWCYFSVGHEGIKNPLKQFIFLKKIYLANCEAIIVLQVQIKTPDRRSLSPAVKGRGGKSCLARTASDSTTGNHIRVPRPRIGWPGSFK